MDNMTTIELSPVLLAANLLQAVGVAGYLVTGTFGELLVAAGVVALGNQAFWAAYSPLVTQVSEPGDRERWYGLVGALRNAGFGLGGLLSGLALTGEAGRPATTASRPPTPGWRGRGRRRPRRAGR